MRIALVYSAYPPLERSRQGDGGADYCKQLAEHLAAEGAKIDVITAGAASRAPLERGVQHPRGIAVHRIISDWGPSALLNGQYRLLRDHLRAIRPDVILVVFPGGGMGCRFVLPALVKLMQPRTPIVAFLFTFLPKRKILYAPLFLAASLWLYLTSSRICLESAWQMNAFGKVLPFLRSRCRFIPTGATIRTQRKYGSGPLHRLRGRMGLDPQSRYIGFLGVLLRNKNVELLLRSAKRVMATHPDVKLLFIGGRAPEQMEATYERQMLRRIEQLGLSNAVHFTGYLEEDSFVAHALCCELCVLPFDQRMGRSTLSFAMGVGLPIITVGEGSPSFLQHGESALLVPRLDPELLARAVERLLDEPDLRRRLSAGALAASEQVSWERLARAWSTLLGEVLHSAPVEDSVGA